LLHFWYNGIMAKKKICKIRGCDLDNVENGFCVTHGKQTVFPRQCTAKAKQKNARCKRRPGNLGVCKIHGGGSLTGHNHPAFENGFFSDVVPSNLAPDYLRALTDPRLMSLKDDTALLQARVSQLLQRIGSGDSMSVKGWAMAVKHLRAYRVAERVSDNEGQAIAMAKLEQVIKAGHSDSQAWVDIGHIQEQKRKNILTEHKINLDMGQMITTEQALALMAAVVASVNNRIEDQKVKDMIAGDIQRLIGAGKKPKQAQPIEVVEAEYTES